VSVLYGWNVIPFVLLLWFYSKRASTFLSEHKMIFKTPFMHFWASGVLLTHTHQESAYESLQWWHASWCNAFWVHHTKLIHGSALQHEACHHCSDSYADSWCLCVSKNHRSPKYVNGVLKIIWCSDKNVLDLLL
jgi:hypothetical protein